MDLYQIRYFLKIADTGSFTKSAEHLFVSQPSLSAAIKKLEQEFGVILFERGKRKVMLTPAGRLFYKKAQIILQEYQSVHSDIEDLKNKPTLKLGTLHTIRSFDFATLIGAFREKHTNVSIELCNGYLEELQDWLERGEIDIAITWLREQDSPQSSQLLFNQSFSLAVYQNHPLAQSHSISLRDLDSQPYIERINCEFWRANPKMFESAGIQPHMVYSANNEEWVISLIQAGMGISIMPIWKDIKDIVYVPIRDLNLSRTVGLKWRSTQVLEVVKWFQDFAVSLDKNP